MILKLPSKNNFVSTFLSPLSKVNNSCVIKVTPTEYSCLLSSADGGLILYCTYKHNLEVSDTQSINVPDLGRLVKILQCIDEPGDLDLEYSGNNISYSSSDIRFKYYLLEDGIISAPAINIEKLKEIKYNCAFEMTDESFLNLIKSSSFAAETDKIYFYTKDDLVYGELTDKQKHNSDSVTRCLTTKFTGDGINDSIPVPFDMIRIIAGNRASKITVLVNTALSILTFEVNTDSAKNVYVVTGLVKA